ncbi:MAG: redoxin domain-containing protein [Crocinitomicaceae bacterium]|nr:redoxin domain-containing protein [Crocinitomicaceae bacterium]
MRTIHPYLHLVGFILVLLTSGCTDTLGELPDFKLKKTDQSEVSVSKIIQDKPAMIVHFDADCKGCQDEAEAIVKNIGQFGDIRIVFASLQKFDKIDLFDRYFKLSQNKNIVVGQDYNNTIPTHFKTYTTPMIVLTDKTSTVRKVIVGEIEMWRLKKFINEIHEL